MVVKILCVCAFIFATKRAIKDMSIFSTDAQKYPGYDMTYNSSESDLVKIKIGEYIWKQKILDVLMDPDRSMYEKMRVYESVYLPSQVHGTNIFSGGLLRHWDFDF
jgi:hypothetical protein